MSSSQPPPEMISLVQLYKECSRILISLYHQIQPLSCLPTFNSTSPSPPSFLPRVTKFTEEHKFKTGGVHFSLIYTPLSPFAFNSATSPVLHISLVVQSYYDYEFNILPLNSATPPSC